MSTNTKSQVLRLAQRAGQRWLAEFVKAGGLWQFDQAGDPKRPHALLTSGLHSDGFVNATLLTARPEVLKKVTADWRPKVATLIEQGGVGSGAASPTWVVGSAFGAITIAYELSRQLSCRAGFTEPESGSLVLKRFPIGPDDLVLVVEDVITTGKSTGQTLAALKQAGARVLPWVFVLVDRSNGKGLEAHKVQTLAGKGEVSPTIQACATMGDVHTWKPEECPLCKRGSEAVRPKGNWEKLTGTA